MWLLHHTPVKGVFRPGLPGVKVTTVSHIQSVSFPSTTLSRIGQSSRKRGSAGANWDSQCSCVDIPSAVLAMVEQQQNPSRTSDSGPESGIRGFISVTFLDLFFSQITPPPPTHPLYASLPPFLHPLLLLCCLFLLANAVFTASAAHSQGYFLCCPLKSCFSSMSAAPGLAGLFFRAAELSAETHADATVRLPLGLGES